MLLVSKFGLVKADAFGVPLLWFSLVLFCPNVKFQVLSGTELNIMTCMNFNIIQRVSRTYKCYLRTTDLEVIIKQAMLLHFKDENMVRIHRLNKNCLFRNHFNGEDFKVNKRFISITSE